MGEYYLLVVWGHPIKGKHFDHPVDEALLAMLLRSCPSRSYEVQLGTIQSLAYCEVDSFHEES